MKMNSVYNPSSSAEAVNEFFDIKYFNEKRFKEPEPVSEDFYIHYFNGEKLAKASSSITKRNESDILLESVPRIGNVNEVFESDFFIPRTPPKPTNIDFYFNYMPEEHKTKLSEIYKNRKGNS